MQPDLNTAVSAEVRAEMARQRVSQESLSDSVAMTQAQLNRRLTGKVGWKVEEVAQIAVALGVPATQLIPDLIAAS